MTYAANVRFQDVSALLGGRTIGEIAGDNRDAERRKPDVININALD